MRYVHIAGTVLVDPTESVASDLAYDDHSGDWRTDGFIMGVGYKF